MIRPVIISDKNRKSLKIKKFLFKNIKKNKFLKSNLIIVIGGDGFMLKTLKKTETHQSYFMELIQEIMVF